MIGKPIKDFLDFNSYERVITALEEERAKEKMGSSDLSRSWTIDVEVLQKDSSTAWAEITTTFLRAPDGRPTGHLGVTRDITARKLADAALKQKSHDLAERVKELSCLYDISQLVDVYDSLDKILQGIVELIPQAWQYPNVASTRMIVGEQEFQTKNFKSSQWKQQSNIFVHGERFGMIEVNYLENMPIQDEGSFLKEERNLLNMISERVGRIIERKKAEETLIQVEEEQRIILDSLSELISHLDTQLKFVWVNRAAQ
jgi:PAS domain S-box-containing protein